MEYPFIIRVLIIALTWMGVRVLRKKEITLYVTMLVLLVMSNWLVANMFPYSEIVDFIYITIDTVLVGMIIGMISVKREEKKEQKDYIK